MEGAPESTSSVAGNGRRYDLGDLSLGAGLLCAVGTVVSWIIFFPFTLQGIRALMLFTFLSALVSLLSGFVGLFKGSPGAMLGILLSVSTCVLLFLSVG